jgi:hypothetical protein
MKSAVDIRFVSHRTLRDVPEHLGVLLPHVELHGVNALKAELASSSRLPTPDSCGHCSDQSSWSAGTRLAEIWMGSHLSHLSSVIPIKSLLIHALSIGSISSRLRLGNGKTQTKKEQNYDVCTRHERYAASPLYKMPSPSTRRSKPIAGGPVISPIPSSLVMPVDPIQKTTHSATPRSPSDPLLATHILHFNSQPVTRFVHILDEV